jgi:hypothetical protein
MSNTLVRETRDEVTVSSDILGTYKRAPMRFVSGKGVELFDD